MLPTRRTVIISSGVHDVGAAAPFATTLPFAACFAVSADFAATLPGAGNRFAAKFPLGCWNKTSLTAPVASFWNFTL